MDKQWSEMTPEEKREQRFQWMLSPDGISFPSAEAEQAYKKRIQALIDVYHVREPEVVPVNLPIGNLPFAAAGVTYHDLMYEPGKARAAAAKFTAETGLDAPLGVSALPGRVLDLLDYKLYNWPGHGLGVNAPGYQFNEGEYMTADEYDQLIRDPSNFWTRVYFPRIFGALEPFRLLQPVTDVTEIVQVVSHFAPYARIEVRQALQRLIEVGEELSRWTEGAGGARRGGGSATPGLMNTFAKAPFDTIGDTLRGTKGIMLDMRRHPDKLLAALDAIAEVSIANAVETLNAGRGLMAYFPLHKGADGWMSQQQFETFYWPSLRKVIWGLIDEGIQVMLFAEGSYDSRLELVHEFPKGTVAWLFDRTDMARAKRILGDKCCISGNVPASLLTAGSAEEVKEYCRKLIEDCAPGGGYILAAGTAQVDNISFENIRAMAEAAQEYGVYRKAGTGPGSPAT